MADRSFEGDIPECLNLAVKSLTTEKLLNPLSIAVA